MLSDKPTVPVSKAMLWTGRILSALPVLAIALGAGVKFVQPPGFSEGIAKIGYSEDLMVSLGIVELFCAALYVIPRTSVLGAILLTGYLGGAIATHVRVDDPFFIPIVLGVLVWLGLYLRDSRLRALVPLRSQNP
ncbi:MAG: DoxX family protein [Pirellulaceae bacterium]